MEEFNKRLELCEEILKREWSLTIDEGIIYVILGNKEYEIYTESQAEDCLATIRLFY